VSRTSPILYARPNAYPTQVRHSAVPLKSCSFDLDDPRAISERGLWLENVLRFWTDPTYLTDLRDAYRALVGADFDGTVLDIGCGMGHMHQLLGIPPNRYTGVDVNELFLEEGRRRFPGLRLLRAPAHDLSVFEDDAFDLALCSDVLIHLAEMEPALRELIRVARGSVLLRLRTGNGAAQGDKTVYDPFSGRLFNRVTLGPSEYHVYYNVLAPEDLHALLTSVGVTEYETLDLLPPEHERLGLTKVFFDASQAKRR
jgi:SAM-dependent methyltransferase